MASVFLAVLNMSLTGAFVIAAICLVRLPLKRAPKLISYCLWAVAGFRLAVPISIERMWSLIPFRADPIPSDIVRPPGSYIDSGSPVIDGAFGNVPAMPPPETGIIGGYVPPVLLPEAGTAVGYALPAVSPLQTLMTAGVYLWMTGVIVMLGYGLVSYVVLKRRMRAATLCGANIYELAEIQTPFVLGVLRPRIYLPPGLADYERHYIVLHEETHIRRRDHIVKFAAYFILCLHWFNPLAWAAFLLMSADMEMACDEHVLKELGKETKADYSRTLVSFAADRRLIAGSPLAFGEGGVKERVKHVLKFKKAPRRVMIAAVVLVVVVGLGLAVSPAAEVGEYEPRLLTEAESERYEATARAFAETHFQGGEIVAGGFSHYSAKVSDMPPGHVFRFFFTAETGMIAKVDLVVPGGKLIAITDFDVNNEQDVYLLEQYLEPSDLHNLRLPPDESADTATPEAKEPSMPMEAAVALAVAYIYNVFDESVDAEMIQMTYLDRQDLPSSWGVIVGTCISNARFVVEFDAVTGELYNLYGPARARFSEDVRRNEPRDWTMLLLTVEDADFYAEVARGFAERMFPDVYTVVPANEIGSATSDQVTVRDAEGNITGRNHFTPFTIRDASNRDIGVVVVVREEQALFGYTIDPWRTDIRPPYESFFSLAWSAHLPGYDAFDPVELNVREWPGWTEDRYPVGPDTISMEAAAQIGADYIRTMFGASIAGKTVFLYHQGQYGTDRTFWRGYVYTCDRSHPADDPWLYMFFIDAITGEWKNISIAWHQDIEALWGEDAAVDEDWELVFGGALSLGLTYEEIAPYIERAQAFANRQWDSTMVSVELERHAVSGEPIYGTALPIRFARDENGDIMATAYVLQLLVRDRGSSRRGQVGVHLGTGELHHIFTAGF
ncbi:MAG: M56 family metallopeptidase [Oscillospiraceae bacterium]|nr:M56 family metallopeptidase [Oscillospiraceae bacterium]